MMLMFRQLLVILVIPDHIYQLYWTIYSGYTRPYILVILDHTYQLYWTIYTGYTGPYILVKVDHIYWLQWTIYTGYTGPNIMVILGHIFWLVRMIAKFLIVFVYWLYWTIHTGYTTIYWTITRPCIGPYTGPYRQTIYRPQMDLRQTYIDHRQSIDSMG